MKAIKIDATARTITEVQVDGFEDIQKHIGCDTFSQGMHLPEGDMLWVDDCGWMTAKKAFTFMGNVFAGNGVITGCDEETGRRQRLSLQCYGWSAYGQVYGRRCKNH
jgi:hypothetical protein